jgi:hypothetical protein
LDLPPNLDVLIHAVSPDGGDDRSYRQADVDGLWHLIDVVLHSSRHPRRSCSSRAPPCTRGETEVGSTKIRRCTPSAIGQVGCGRVRTERGAADTRPGSCASAVSMGPGERSSSTACETVQLCDAEAHRSTSTVAVDCEPCCEVLRWSAGQLGLPPAPRIDESTPAARRRRPNKRCPHTRRVGSDVRFVYPTYREGLAQVLSQAEVGA